MAGTTKPRNQLPGPGPNNLLVDAYRHEMPNTSKQGTRRRAGLVHLHGQFSLVTASGKRRPRGVGTDDGSLLIRRWRSGLGEWLAAVPNSRAIPIAMKRRCRHPLGSARIWVWARGRLAQRRRPLQIWPELQPHRRGDRGKARPAATSAVAKLAAADQRIQRYPAPSATEPAITCEGLQDLGRVSSSWFDVSKREGANIRCRVVPKTWLCFQHFGRHDFPTIFAPADHISWVTESDDEFDRIHLRIELEAEIAGGLF